MMLRAAPMQEGSGGWNAQDQRDSRDAFEPEPHGRTVAGGFA